MSSRVHGSLLTRSVVARLLGAKQQRRRCNSQRHDATHEQHVAQPGRLALHGLRRGAARGKQSAAPRPGSLLVKAVAVVPRPRRHRPYVGAAAGGCLQQRRQRLRVPVAAEEPPRHLGSVFRRGFSSAAQLLVPRPRRRGAARAAPVATVEPVERSRRSAQLRYTTHDANWPERQGRRGIARKAASAHRNPLPGPSRGTRLPLCVRRT